MFDERDNPQISIIVPVYNPGKDKLARCLNSIVEQTFTDYEAILIDDGSNDGTAEFCDEFCKIDIRFKVIHQQNQGVSAARNKGISESAGNYICFIDCDDYVKREYLEVLFTLISKENIDLAICGVEIYTEGGLELFSQQREEVLLLANENINSKIIELLENRYFNYVYAKLYSGAIIRNNNLCFNVGVSLGEDTLFVMEYMRYVNCMIISGYTQYVYIKYESGTLTSGKHVEKYLKLMEINGYIEEVFVEKWKNSEISMKIDERKLMCAEWAIESAEQEKTWKDRVAAIKKVLNSTDFINAINRSGKRILDVKIFLLVTIQDTPLNRK